MPVRIIIKRRACAKCRGDMAYERDHDGVFWTCQQCGTIHDIPTKE